MFLLLSLCMCGLLLRGDAQDRAALWRGNDRSGRCQYTFTVPSPVEASCPQTGGPEVEGLKARLNLLEVLVSRLTGGETGSPQGAAARAQSGLQEALTRVTGERNLLQGEKERLEKELGGLQRRMEEMRRETERLRNRPCPPQTPVVPPSSPLQDSGLTRPAGDSAWQYGSPGFQELRAEVTEVPAPDASEDNTGCGELVSVAEPVTHRKADNIAGKYGVWMQDPEAVSPYGPNMVWRIDTIGSDVRQLFGYDDMEQLSKGFPSKVLVLPELVESTGATLYRGSLYYQRRRSRSIIRFDLASETTAARRDLPHAGFHGQYPYSWGGYTDIDLSVDENGLWAVYSTSKAKGAIVISQLDPHSLEVKRSWETNIRKNSVANSFIICGKLYTVASYTAPDTIINYVYDTETSQGKPIAIPFRNKYRYNSMIDYNLAQRKLFAWDNFHMVSYDIRLGRQQAN
ncbi:myocilin isoform X2 [Plectropomus leopardus]|uniref:myocilin isoform X2 n=1 Tax=Plectropomus leopardus TaxID=160734 RepID=UPI001C4D2E33|nr:myocilin isoform X2 [Plectropomus leopardus]